MATANRCLYCAVEGNVGFVVPNSCYSTTLMAWSPTVDPKTGEIDNRDPNTTTQGNHCTNGHHWTEKSCMGETTYHPPLPEASSNG